MKFKLNVKCYNCDDCFYPNTNTEAGILEAANEADYHLWDDEFYCDNCYENDVKPDIDFEGLWQTEKELRLKADKQSTQLFEELKSEQEKETLNNKRGRAEFDARIYEGMYQEQKAIVSKLMDKPKKKWWWQK